MTKDLDPIWDESDYVTCGRCSHRFVLQDAFERGEGSEETCPNCAATLECVEEEALRRWAWKFTPKGGWVPPAVGQWRTWTRTGGATFYIYEAPTTGPYPWRVRYLEGDEQPWDHDSILWGSDVSENHPENPPAKRLKTGDLNA